MSVKGRKKGRKEGNGWKQELFGGKEIENLGNEE